MEKFHKLIKVVFVRDYIRDTLRASFNQADFQLTVKKIYRPENIEAT